VKQNGNKKRSRLKIEPHDSKAQAAAMKASFKLQAPKPKPVRIAQHEMPKITG
jgi:hypothetical protein